MTLRCYDQNTATNLLTVEEATQALGISRSILWRRLRSGDIPSIRRGGRRLIQVSGLRKAPGANVPLEIPSFTEDHPIFRLIGAGRGGANLALVTNTRF
jgi:excisionase family DNA binding protein